MSRPNFEVCKRCGAHINYVMNLAFNADDRKRHHCTGTNVKVYTPEEIAEFQKTATPPEKVARPKIHEVSYKVSKGEG